MASNSCSQKKKQQQSWCLRVVVLTSVMLMVKVVKPQALSEESMQRVEMMCNVTSYHAQCYKTLSSVNSSDPRVLLRASLVKAMEEHVQILGSPWNLLHSSNEAVNARFKVCEELMVDSLEYLNETTERFDEFGEALDEVEIDIMREKLSHAIVDHATCMENFEEIEELDFLSYQRTEEGIKNLKDSMQKGRELVSNSLAIVTKILGGITKEDTSLPGHAQTRFPHWFTDEKNSLFTCPLSPNVTVAVDGSGDYRTIGEAVSSVPEKSNSRFLIHIKEGLYREYVVVPKEKKNVWMYGDGNTKTVVSGDRSRVDNPNLTTLGTATFAVYGEGFVVRDMAFVNTAGAEKNQAVAFYSKSSYSIMYRCTFQGFQDTLYPHAGDQFYRECNIIGTVDFICGAARAVFQNCAILPRHPFGKQVDTVTAQSATDQNMKSGFTIINSKILPYEGARFTGLAYLGRTWRNFARVVVIKSLLGDLINEKGWVAWEQTLDPPATVKYGEYQNYGPGSGVTNRVKWMGYQPKMTEQEALKFTVNALFNPHGWLNKSCVPYDGSL